MSTASFPVFPGIGFPIPRQVMWDGPERAPGTIIHVARSGKETRVNPGRTAPRYRWTVPLHVLRQDATYAEFASLVGFFNQRNGRFDSFLYSDPYDSVVSGGVIGVGNGVTTAFQLVRGFGGFVEPILAPNTLTAVYQNSVFIPAAGINGPGAPTLSQVAGGAIGATTYYAKITYVSNSGETTASVESNLAVGANNLLRVASPPAEAGAVAWNAYVSTASGTETKQNAVPLAIGTPWTEPTSGLIAGAGQPAQNTTGWTITTWGAAAPGVITFLGAPVNGIVISADFSFYWPCRFDVDTIAPSNMMLNLFELKELPFVSIK